MECLWNKGNSVHIVIQIVTQTATCTKNGPDSKDFMILQCMNEVVNGIKMLLSQWLGIVCINTLINSC